MGTLQKLTPKKAAFLASYPIAGTVTAACAVAKISRTSHYMWLREDEDYREAFEEAKAELKESLEREAVRRARDGWEEPVFHEGKVCGYRPKFSDTLMIFLLKALDPQKYRDNAPQPVEPESLKGKPVFKVIWGRDNDVDESAAG